MSHFTPFEDGQVKAHLYHGLGPSQIAGIITKSDGKTRFSHTAVASIIEKLENDRKWRGERPEGSGGPGDSAKPLLEAARERKYLAPPSQRCHHAGEGSPHCKRTAHC